MFDFKFGWLKDPHDERDYLHPTVQVVQLQPLVNLSGYLPPVRNQGKIGSCSGHGIGANITATYKQQKGDSEWESPTWIYNLGRALQGWLHIDMGAYPRDCLEQLRGYGLLKEQYWPYNDTTLDVNMPNSTQQAMANKWGDFTYYRCVDGVDGILSALDAGHIVSIGSPWFTDWMYPKSDGILPEVTANSPTVGGHETCLYGYDLAAKRLFGMNSWGEKWGKDGHFSMPFSAIDVFKTPPMWGYDAHYVTFTPTTIEPKPEPRPKPGHKCWLLNLLKK